VERAAWLCVLLAWLLIPIGVVAADEALRELINRELAPPSGAQWPKSSDGEFLRRVTLDLNGMPPGADVARQFLNDTDPQKREKLIESLLQSPLFARHLATTLDVMLMERRPNTHVSQEEWQAWLLKSVRDNKPWNVLAQEIMTADGDVPENRAAARFYLDRNSEPHVITRDLGRIFFGRDMQCNQCHDSPLVSDYLQRDYHGLLAIASTGYAVTKKVADKDVTVLGERSGSDLTFESVFDKGNAHRTGARLPSGVSIVEPFLYPGEEYEIAPADGVRSVPKFSRRAALAEQATNGSNRAFNENIANRLWAFMLGRGLVHPLDMMHPENPCASPSLLKELGERLAAMNFDMRVFLREIALSDVYQRPFDMTPQVIEALAGEKAERDRLAAEVETLDARAKDAAAASSDAEAAFAAAETAMLPTAAEVDTVRGQYAEANKKLAEAQKALNEATSAHAAKQKIALTLQEALTSLQSAAAAIPSDMSLAETTAKLAEQTQQFTGELSALKKATDEKAAAVIPLEESLAATKVTLDAAVQKLQPLLDAVRAEEARVVATRSATQIAQLVKTSVRSELNSLERMVAASDRESEVREVSQQAAEREVALQAATQQVSEFTVVVQERSEVLRNAEQAMSTAAAAVVSQQMQVESSRTSAALLIDASMALKNAQAAVQNDQTLAVSIETLIAKAATAQAKLGESEKSLSIANQNSEAAVSAVRLAQSAIAQANEELGRRQQIASQNGSAVRESRDALVASSTAYEKAIESVPADLSSTFALSQLKPLTPEQMCWSVFKVTTVYDRYLATETAELDKSSPLSDDQKNDPAVLRARAIELEQRTYDKLKGNLGSYVQIYGGGAGQPQNDFFASPDQALFTSNGSAINSWVVPAGDNPTERIIKATDPKLAAEELYLGVLTRLPTEDEFADVATFLAARPDRNKAAQELVWGLISSAEFRFNK
jgi:hypothetical protein